MFRITQDHNLNKLKFIFTLDVQKAWRYLDNDTSDYKETCVSLFKKICSNMIHTNHPHIPRGGGGCVSYKNLEGNSNFLLQYWILHEKLFSDLQIVLQPQPPIPPSRIIDKYFICSFTNCVAVKLFIWLYYPRNN